MNKHDMAKFAKQFYINMQIEEVLPLEEYEIYIKTDYPTASWRFYQGKHQIIIGTNIFVNSMDILTSKQKLKYLRAFLHHELAHSIWSEKDIKSIASILRDDGYSFELWNLFEDARIEEKMRHHLKTSFSWSSFEVLDIPTNPVSMLFYIIQCEHKHKDMQDAKKYIPNNLLKIFDLVVSYYHKILACQSSKQLIPILKRWYLDFPDTPKNIQRIILNGNLFSKECETFTDNEKFDELIEGLDNLLLVYDLDSISEDKKHPRISTNKNNSNSSSLLQKSKVEVAFDVRQSNMLLKKMEKLFLIENKFLSTTIPSKKLNIKRLASRTNKRFKRKSIPTVSKKKITIILDLSASMLNTISNMRLLINVLNNMAIKHIIDATLILTAVNNLYEAQYEILPMPLEENTTERLVPCYGGEGLKNTMMENIELLSSSDFIWILTDGFIDNESLDKEFFHKKNIRTHAMYIGDTSYKEEMLKSFDYVICEKDVIDLAKVIFKLVK